MTYNAVMPRDIESTRHIGRWRIRPDAALCIMALLGSVSIGACLMHAPALLSEPTPSQPRVAATTPSPTQPLPAIVETSASTGTTLAPLQPLRRLAKVAPPTRVAAVTLSAQPNLPAPVAVATQSMSAAQPAATLAEAAPLRPGLETPVADAVEPDASASIPAATALENEIPLPVRRPAQLAALETAPPSTLAMPRRVAAAREPAPTAQAAIAQSAAPPAQSGAARADGNSFFDKLFKPQPAGPALAYAAPESQNGGLFSWLGGSAPRAASPDRQTAIYDISAHTVTLPDGTRLEAHSGYGEAKDDPGSVAMHMRGVTPPNMYDLKPREALFHGVRALRMTPIGAGATYGRAGLLTHSYMLRGREGESNGCVVFRDYEAFLRAYDSGVVRRMLVVSRAS